MSVGGKTGGGREWRCGGGRWEGEGERGKVGIGDREVGDGATRKMGERRWGNEWRGVESGKEVGGWEVYRLRSG